MTEAAASATDLLAADPAPAASGADTTPAASGADTLPASSGADSTPGAAGDVSWLDSIDDPELAGWAKNKAFPSVKDALASARNLELLLGRDKVPLPKDENDKEGWDRVHKALGRPDEPAGYGLDKIKDASPEFAAAASDTFHKLGLSAKQGEALASFWQEATAKAIEGEKAEFEARSRADMADLHKEWGSTFDAQAEQARRAARQFGIDKEAMGKIEAALGTKPMMTLLAKIGGGLTEDPFEGSESGAGGFGMSVDQARAKLNGLMQDKEYSKAYIAGDSAKRAEVERLNRILAGA